MSDANDIGTLSGGDPGGAPTEGRRIDPGFSRNMKIIGALVAVVVLAMVFMFYKMFSGGNTSAPPEGAVNVNAGSNAGQLRNDMSQTEAMQKMLLERQAQEAEAARRQGRSHIPSEAVGSVEQVKPAEPPPQQSTYQNTAYNMTNPAAEQQLQTLRAGLRVQLESIIQPSISQGDGVRQSLRVEQRDQPRNAQASADSQAGAATQRVNTPTPATQPVVIQALEIMTGKLANPITALMGKPSYASALVTSGPFAGAFLVGTSTMVETESIETTFTTMRHGNKAYKIDAIVLDEQTAKAGMDGNVDRRILQRYVLPVTVAAAQGYYQASAQTGTSVIGAVSGTLGTATPAPTSEQARNAGIAAGLQIASREAQKAAQEPIRSSVERDMAIGILFRAPVREELR